jgi:hypothetical protein
MLVYDASQFAAFGGPILITQLAIRPNTAQPGPGSVIEHNLRTFLSTTPMSPATLSSNFADNIGPDYTVVACAAVPAFTTAYQPGPGSTMAFDITVPLETPFRYDPAAGNLLLEFQQGPPAPEGSMIFEFVAGDPTFPRYRTKVSNLCNPKWLRRPGAAGAAAYGTSRGAKSLLPWIILGAASFGPSPLAPTTRSLPLVVLISNSGAIPDCRSATHYPETSRT